MWDKYRSLENKKIPQDPTMRKKEYGEVLLQSSNLCNIHSKEILTSATQILF